MRKFVVSGAVRQGARRAVPNAAQQQEQMRAVLAAPGLSQTERQVMLDVVLAGGTVDLARSGARHAPRMPGVAVGGATPRAHAGSERPRMPGIVVGGALRTNASTRGGRMPGIPVGAAAR